MATVVAMPKLGFDMAEGTLVRWVRAVGESVQKGDVLAEIETDKATVEVEAGESGVVRRHLVAEGVAVPIGTPIAILGTADEPIDDTVGAAPAAPRPAAAAAAPSAVPSGVAAPPAEAGRLPSSVRASPLARRMAREASIDLGGIAGSGPGGRVTKRDVADALQRPARAGSLSPAGGALPSAAPRPSQDEVVSPSRLRQAISRRMTAAKQQVPHFYLTADLDVAQLVQLRAEANAALGEADRLSLHDFIVRAAALSLLSFPALNASLDGERIVRHAAIHVGTAVAVEGGLLTIVVHDSDTKSVQAISAELRQLVARAREGKVRPEDIEGSTFTVSNLGMYGVDVFSAIINPPEAAILAVGAAREVPVVEAGRVVPGWRMAVTLSADHRVTDGAEAAQWLQHLRTYLEHPVRLLL